VTDKVEAGIVVLLREKHDQVVSSISSFIKEHKLTEDAFQ
jgi:hypothetical protein